MTGKAPYISLLLAALLGIGAWLSTRTPALSSEQQASSGPVAAGNIAFAIDPATVVAIARDASGERSQSIRRQTDGRWVFDMQGDGGTWPTDSQAVATLLRSMAETRATGDIGDMTDSNAGLLDDAPKITLTHTDGGVTTLRVARATFGGNRVVSVSTPDGRTHAALISARFAAPLIDPGPVRFRLQQAIPGMGRDVSRVTMQHAERRFGLARVDGRWMLQEPMSAPAEPDAVQVLLDALAAIRVSEFRDAAPGDPRLLEGGLTITVERDVRSFAAGAEEELSPSVDVRRRTLSVGSLFDPIDDIYYALAGEAEGVSPQPLLITMAPFDLGALLEPLTYISRKPMRSAPSLVQAIVLHTPGSTDATHYARGINGWEVRDAQNALLRVLSEDDGHNVDAVLAALASPAIPLATPQGISPAITIDVLDRDNNVLHSVGIALDHASGAPLVLANGIAYQLQQELPQLLADQLNAR